MAPRGAVQRRHERPPDSLPLQRGIDEQLLHLRSVHRIRQRRQRELAGPDDPIAVEGTEQHALSGVDLGAERFPVDTTVVGTNPSEAPQFTVSLSSAARSGTKRLSAADDSDWIQRCTVGRMAPNARGGTSRPTVP